MSDERRTIVVADTSGSMAEQGKLMLVRNLLAHIRQWGWQAHDAPATRAPLLVRWSTEARVWDVPAHEDLPMLSAGGRALVAPLLELLEPLTHDGVQVVLILLSDGNIAATDVSAFQSWLRRHPSVSVRAVAIGLDAATTTLARMTNVADAGARRASEAAVTGGRGWFPPEELLWALEAWPVPRSAPLPERIAELLADTRGTGS